MIGDESLLALLNQPVLIAEDIQAGKVELKRFSKQKGLVQNTFPPLLTYESSNDRWPIVFQGRHGGIFFWPLKILSKWIPPLWAWRIYHYSLTVLSLVLLGMLLLRLESLEISLLTLFICSIDPLWASIFAMSTTEQFFIPTTLAAILLLSSNKKKLIFYGGLCLGLGLSNKITFVFYLLALFVLFHREALNVCKLKRFWAGFFVGSSVFFMTFSFSDLLLETKQIAGYFSFLPWLRDSWTFLVQKRAHLDLFQNDSYLHDVKYGKYRLDTQLYHLLFCAVYFIGYFLSGVESSKKKWLLKCFLVFLGWTLCFQIAVRTEVYLPEYYFGALPLTTYLLASHLSLVYKRLLQKIGRIQLIGIMLILVFLPLMIESLSWLRDYRKSGAVVYNNAELADELVTQLLKQTPIKSLYSIAEEDQARLEWLSGEKLRPVYLFDLIAKKRWLSFEELLAELEKGRIFVSLNDQNSSWYGLWGGGIVPKEIVRRARSLGIMILHQNFYPKSGKARVWSFDFMKISD